MELLVREEGEAEEEGGRAEELVGGWLWKKRTLKIAMKFGKVGKLSKYLIFFKISQKIRTLQ